METYFGTSGFSYPAWKGVFYPRGLPAREMLPYYGARLPTVELNASFYKLPPRESFEKWAAQVPGGFRFAVKAPQRITHHKKLIEVGAELEAFARSFEGLGDKLGPLLFQLPPTFRADLPRLRAFLEALPPASPPVALEFRHASWFTPETFALLEARGVACVGGELGEGEQDPPLVRTAPFAYLRLRRDSYKEDELVRWAERAAGLSVDTLYVYFKHEPSAPGDALRLAELWAEQARASGGVASK